MALRVFLLAAAISRTFVDAIPTIAFPLNSQVPPVARISEPFSYTFSNGTFFSTLPITYSLENGPRWLSLDAATRTLSGTPRTDDLGAEEVTGFKINLAATDSTGSASLESTLVVSHSPAPAVLLPVSEQLPSFGEFSEPNTLLYNPSATFSFHFDSKTFSGLGLSYYAVMSDNTPLPSWINFDSSTLSFSGKTPDLTSLIQPPQTFEIRLIASDVEGFTGASIGFEIEVGVHLLAIASVDLEINATHGQDVEYKGLAESLKIDGRPAKMSELVSITAQTPSWLVFDSKKLMFSGIVPADATSENITILVTDVYGDTADGIVQLHISDLQTNTFSKTIGVLNVTIGSSFEYDLGTYLNNKSDVDLAAQFSTSESWLSFDTDTFLLSGLVPSNTKPSVLEVNLTATSKSLKASNSQVFNLDISQADVLPKTSASSTPTTLHTSTSSTSSGQGTRTPSPASSTNKISTGIIVGIVVPISLLFSALLLILICCMTRRRSARNRPESLQKSEISTPQEAASSVEEIIRPPRIAEPKPLQLDMTGFVSEFSQITRSEILSISTNSAPNRKSGQNLRRSRTESGLYDARLSRHGDFGPSPTRARAYSDNALSRTEDSWRSTQFSGGPTLSGTSNTNSSHRLTRNYSNYSRKGHMRRSAMLFSSNPISPVTERTSSAQSTRPGETILGLRDSKFHETPVDNFSALRNEAGKRWTSDQSQFMQRPSRACSTRRHSRFMPNFGKTPPTVVGHGRRDSIASKPTSDMIHRGSLGHGASPILNRESQTWRTIDEDIQNRNSATSNYSDQTEITAPGPFARMTVRAVTKSPTPLNSSVGTRSSTKCFSPESDGSTKSRPVSRRIGSSPFFGGSSLRNSRKSARKVRTSFADSPTVPEEAIMSGLDERMYNNMRNETEGPRDSFGISYGHAREGTRQLRSFIQGQLNRKGGSLKSIESKDSRFESAVSLPRSQGKGKEAQEDDGYEDYYSEGSWETQQEIRDKDGNFTEFASEEAFERAKQRSNNLQAAKTQMNNLMSEIGIGPHARVFASPLRRPISVDAQASRKLSSKAKVEKNNYMDYTAYI